MYKREKPINLKGSTSALINNLTVSVNPEKRQITYAVAHKAAVNLVTTQADGQTVAHKQIICKEPSQAHGSSMVIQVNNYFKIPFLYYVVDREYIKSVNNPT